MTDKSLMVIFTNKKTFSSRCLLENTDRGNSFRGHFNPLIPVGIDKVF